MSLPPATDLDVRPAPAGLVDVREVVSGLQALPGPPWAHPELRFLVRPELAERLARAAAALPEGLRLGYWEGLRPLTAQQRLWEAGRRFLRELYPGSGECELEASLELYVARPESVGEAAPPHSTGSAVDLAPLNSWNQVQTPETAWGRLSVESLAAHLRAEGLAGYAAEWWHWSYGDLEWARAYDQPPIFLPEHRDVEGPGAGI